MYKHIIHPEFILNSKRAAFFKRELLKNLNNNIKFNLKL